MVASPRRVGLRLVGGDAPAPRLLEVEGDAARIGCGDLREHGAHGPVGLGREVGDAVQETRRQIARTHERYAPHGRKREHIVQRAVRRALGCNRERLREVGEAMRAQPGQPDASGLQRIQPAPAECVTTRNALEE
jgi:hypothetical protein